MGIKSSKHPTKSITDYTKVTIPPNYIMLKISSYNINIKNTVNLSNEIKNILIFIVSSYKEKNNDIICLQGINDYKAATELVKEIKKYMKQYNVHFYFAPEFDDVYANSRSTKLSVNRSANSRSHLSRNTENTRNSQVQNIIISRYPIQSSIFSKLSDKLVDDITNIKTVIGANININNNLISVYCTELSDNLEAANIDNKFIREKELEELNVIIQGNINKIKSEPVYDKMHKTDIHFVIGTLHIDDDSVSLNEEYQNMLSNFKFTDIFRCLHTYDVNMGYTSVSNRRMDYILLYLTDDVYDPTSPYYNDIQNVDSTSKLLNILFRRYSVHFLESSTREDVSQNYSSSNYPIEVVMMVKIDK